MKLSKITISISLSILLVICIFIARFTYSIGQQNASLTVKEATPLQLAEAMQSDDFYGNYPKTMLLVNGVVQSVNKQDRDFLVQFEITQSPTILGKVTCNIRNAPAVLKAGDSVHVLTVAHDAERRNKDDVFMLSCFILTQKEIIRNTLTSPSKLY